MSSSVYKNPIPQTQAKPHPKQQRPKPQWQYAADYSFTINDVKAALLAIHAQIKTIAAVKDRLGTDDNDTRHNQKIILMEIHWLNHLDDEFRSTYIFHKDMRNFGITLQPDGQVTYNNPAVQWVQDNAVMLSNLHDKCWMLRRVAENFWQAGLDDLDASQTLGTVIGNLRKEAEKPKQHLVQL